MLGGQVLVIEGFVLSEIARLADRARVRAHLFHYRNRDGVEVDGIVELPDGRIAAIEVKAASTVGTRDFRGLEHLAHRLADDFSIGLVFYTGSNALPFGDRMWAIPISALWNP